MSGIPEYASVTRTQLFKRLDTDNNEKVSTPELQTWWSDASTSANFPTEEFRLSDQDSDGQISMVEFMGPKADRDFYDEVTRDGTTYALDAFGFEIDIHGGEWSRDDRITFANNARINTEQPPAVPKFTPHGFKKMPIPASILEPVLKFRAEQLEAHGGAPPKEGCVQGYINNCGAHPTRVMLLPWDLRELTEREMKPILDEWAGTDLEPTSTYGIRRYVNTSVLQAHVDVLSTHVISAILNVGQDVVDDWPLQILDHNGTVNELTMEAGEMILYESAKNVHGRVRPFHGTYFDNMFVHFRPVSGWEKWSGVPNGEVVSDHVADEL